MLALILRDGVNMRYFDEWSYAGMFRQVHNGDYSGIWAPLNESRQPVTRILILLAAFSFHGDVRAQMVVSWLIACITAFNLCIPGRQTVKTSLVRAICWTLASLLVFSPLQYENWLWGNQIGLFIPFACLTGSLIIVRKWASNFAAKLAIAALCLIATFSFACGMVTWIIMTPWIWRSGKNRALFRGIWLVLIAVTVILYFRGMDVSTDLGPDWLRDPFATMKFYLVFLGNAVAESMGIPIVATYGAFIFLLSFVLVIYIIRKERRAQNFPRLSPWLSILAYGAVVAAQATKGRLRLGINAALFPRYVTFANILLIALIHIIAILVEEVNPQRRQLQREAIWLMVAFLINFGWIYYRSLDRYDELRVARLRAEGALEYSEIDRDRRSLEFAIPQGGSFLPLAEDLDDLGLLVPHLVRDARIPARAIGRQPTGGEYVVRPLKLGGINLFGQARVNGGPASNVALALDNTQGVPVIFRVIPVGYGDLSTSARWTCSLQPDEIPAGRITAWAIDARTAELYPLHQVSSLPELGR
jgi:hypothetical protein